MCFSCIVQELGEPNASVYQTQQSNFKRQYFASKISLERDRRPFNAAHLAYNDPLSDGLSIPGAHPVHYR